MEAGRRRVDRGDPDALRSRRRGQGDDERREADLEREPKAARGGHGKALASYCNAPDLASGRATKIRSARAVDARQPETLRLDDDRGPDLDLAVHRDDVRVRHADAAVADRLPEHLGLRGAVEADLPSVRMREADPAQTERIVGSGRDASAIPAIGLLKSKARKSGFSTISLTWKRPVGVGNCGRPIATGKDTGGAPDGSSIT